MIDKNDVKMPVQKENIELNNQEQIDRIEKLLTDLNQVENKQELRLKENYYSRFHWFGGSAEKKDKSYFSYQEEAVYDFIFNLNKSGILSDQVGMGKTIEAGMIISELASRNELNSLLIIVPNEIMAEKWEYELEKKFGIKYHKRIVDGVEEIYPQVTAIKNYDGFCKCVFDCLAEEKFVELCEYKFEHTYKAKEGSSDRLDNLIASFVEADIREAVRMINSGFEINEMEGVQVVFDGKKFAIKGTKFERAYTYDAGGEIAKYLNGKPMDRMLETTINSTRFKKPYESIIKQELMGLYTLIGDYFTTLPKAISALAQIMKKKFPFLVIPIAYSDHSGEQVVLREFLNRTLSTKIENYKHKYIVKDENDKISEVFEEYRIIDFFIDVSYQTMIVDEVHDYIDVSAKVERMKFHTSKGYGNYPSKDYNRYELFDDYYFIKKSSLYKKLKNLADKAQRKIFLTATPIKSDMVDFYLLTLLASNKDSKAYNDINEHLLKAFPRAEAREEAIEALYNSFKACLEETSARHFCEHSSYFFAAETEGDESGATNGRYRYAYFNNSFLRSNVGNENLIREYILSQLSYMSMEEVVLELILAYNAECGGKRGNNFAIRQVFERLDDLLADTDGNELQTRVVFRTLFNNNLKVRFEEDFTDEKGKPIKRIRELLENDEGARKWNKTYRKYGIRHTRHQTYNLAKCEQLDKLSANRKERYQNLPIWPRRDGKVIFLVRDDIFFDCYLNVKRITPHAEASVVRMQDLPNYERLKGSPEEKQERFENALAIFDYINNSMSGGLPDSHEPSSSRYESVDLDDSGMVDYKLALVNKLMAGHEQSLGSVSKKVLLFAENGREKITEWFKYQECEPLYDPRETLDPVKKEEYAKKWQSYTVNKLGREWKVSENAEDLSNYDGNLLIIIDPKRYEKGVDLQKADTIINFDINYCPLKMEQRIGRIDRIRPSGKVSEINIISFVPLNDMSGYVINFFANELKMFTQWMGETTGIVSVPEEGNAGAKGEDVSFEGKVYDLEKYYRYIYTLCKENVESKKVEEMAKEYALRFPAIREQNSYEYKTSVDFKFLSALRPHFDKAFRNSVSGHRAGYEVPGNKRIMRFNSALGPFAECASEKCAGCKNAALCKEKGKPIRNVYAEFKTGVEKFFAEGERFYRDEEVRYKKEISDKHIFGNENYKEMESYLERRTKEFKTKGEEVKKLLPAQTSSDPFTMPFESFDKIFSAMKSLYWDSVVENYIGKIIDQFHKQCDSVLNGARLFEKFVKTLSIADFMNNMEGTL